jgi:imidazolonepropionase-like amidohydrolase
MILGKLVTATESQSRKEHRMKSTFTTLVPALLMAMSAAASESCDKPDIAITNVRLFDGETVVDNATVVTSCTTIRVVAHGSEVFELVADTVTINGEGKTLLPGLIDTHTHTWSVPMLERPLDFGVTTVMGMGSTNPTFASTMRAEREIGAALDRADLYAAVLWVTAPGSHGTQWAEVPTLEEPEDAAAFVAARLNDGADYIKLIYDNFKMFDTDIPTLSKETMEAVVEAAHAQGVMAVVHSRDVEAWADVVNAGVDGIVHLPVDEVPDAELIQQIKDKDIWVSGNLSLSRPLGESLIDDPYIGPLLTESEKENLLNFRASHREGGDQVALDTARALHAKGITFLPGSDTPNGGTALGATMHRDLEEMVEIGFTPVEALKAATAGAAEAFKLSDRGRIAVGLQADLLLVEGVPDMNIKDTRNIVAVIKGGKVHMKGAGDS